MYNAIHFSIICKILYNSPKKCPLWSTSRNGNISCAGGPGNHLILLAFFSNGIKCLICDGKGNTQGFHLDLYLSLFKDTKPLLHVKM